MIKIEGLNEAQVALCDILWGLETFDDIVEWINELDEDDRHEALLMIELMNLAILEDEPCDDLSDAVKLINRVKEKV